MQSSFRISKVFLSKAASFGLGLAVGDRYVNSQSGQRLEVLEEASLRRMHMRPLVGTELHELGVELGLSVPSVSQDSDGDIDVDSSNLFGYSRSCFSSALPPVATQLCPLVQSNKPRSSHDTSSSSTQPSSDSSTETTPNEVLETPRRDHDSQSRTPITAAPRLMSTTSQHVQSLEVDVRHVAIDIAPPPKCMNKAEDDPPFLKLNRESADRREQDKHKHKHKKQQEQSSEAAAAGAAAVLWSSLVKADQCTICADLLAVPVSTSCDHAFCGICFLDMQRAHHDVFPLDCPNCRAPLQQGEQPPDQRRDGRIAQQVDCFVQQQEWLEQQQACGGCGSGLQRDESWREHYAEWLNRREQFHLATAAPFQLEKPPRDLREEMDMLLENVDDDVLGEEVARLTREVSAVNAGTSQAAAPVLGDIFVALGLAVAICGVVLLSRQSTQRPVLRDVAAALFNRR